VRKKWYVTKMLCEIVDHVEPRFQTMYREPDGATKPVQDLDKVCSRIPVSIVFGSDNDYMYAASTNSSLTIDGQICGVVDPAQCRMHWLIRLQAGVFPLSRGSTELDTWYAAPPCHF
jgi:hypothetical protein